MTELNMIYLLEMWMKKNMVYDLILSQARTPPSGILTQFWLFHFPAYTVIISNQETLRWFFDPLYVSVLYIQYAQAY